MSIPQAREDVRSEEEIQFVWWLQEATRAGFVDSWDYEQYKFHLLKAQTYSETIQLKTKKKLVERKLFQDVEYMPDFTVELTCEGVEAFRKAFRHSVALGQSIIYVDTKGEYVKFHSDTQHFQLVRKLVYANHNIYVERVVPSKFFAQTWAPSKLRWMKNRKVKTLTALGKRCMSVEEFTKGCRQ